MNSCTQSLTDIQRKLACKGTHVSTTTVMKAIKVAGVTASKLSYGQMVRDVNKEKKGGVLPTTTTETLLNHWHVLFEQLVWHT